MESVTLQPLPQRVGKKTRKALNRILNNNPKLTPQRAIVVPAQQPVMATIVNQKKRRRRRRNGEGPIPITSPSGVLQNYLMPQAIGVSTGRSNAVRSINKGLRKAIGTNSLTSQGVAFLKCAFAAPDFDGTNVYGVPDDYGGKSMAIRHRAVTPFTFAAGRDYYFLVAPIPGIAFYSLAKASGVPVDPADTWNPTPYSNFQNLFPNNIQGNYVTQKFRMVSSHIELVCTTNNNNWTGSVTAFKLPLQMYEAQNVSATINGVNYYSLSGLDGVINTDADMYSGPFNLGVYGGIYNKGAKFDFHSVLRNQLGLPDGGNFNPVNGDWGALAAQIPGFDNNFESYVVKVSGIGTNPNNTCLIRSWSCVEYQFTPGSVMYESQLLHGDCDPVALEVYRKLVLELPIGVSYLDNSNFWNRVLSILSTMGIALSSIPGPYGSIAGGVGAVASGLRQLTM